MATRLALIGDRDSVGKRDWSSAFRPEAARYVAGGDEGSKVAYVSLDIPAVAQRELILSLLVNHSPDELAFFCHGFTKKVQLGFDIAHVGELAEALAIEQCDKVALYACSTGSGPGIGGDGGFADRLRDAMCSHSLTGCRVLAHRTSGHCSMNPRKAFFEGLGSPTGGTGGMDIVVSSTPLWKRWCKRLRDPKDPLRFNLLSMSIAEIHRELMI